MVDRVLAHRVPVPGPVGGGLADRGLDERGLFRQRAFKPGISPVNVSIANAV